MTNQLADERMPTSLKWVVAGVWLHAVINVAAGIFLLALIHGRHGDGLVLVTFIAFLSILIGILLGTCAAVAPGGARWTRKTVLVIEWLTIVAGVRQLFSGSIISLAGMAIAGIIVLAYSSAEGKEWFTV
ncbi:hypothetical protein ACFXDE_06855 [Kitasatospora sp. NPDC059408]|uniref:hypothetical protein n=1 Tax=Kitasatospora sp. NPDC059408 TaxID=3346823 RepID=UPI00368780F9